MLNYGKLSKFNFDLRLKKIDLERKRRLFKALKCRAETWRTLARMSHWGRDGGEIKHAAPLLDKALWLRQLPPDTDH